MEKLKTFLTFIYAAMCAVFAALLLSIGVGSYLRGSVGHAIMLFGTSYALPEIYFVAVGTCLLLFAGLTIFVLMKAQSPKPTFSYSNPEGKVEISYGAIEDFVVRIGSEFDEIRSIRPEILATKNNDMIIKVNVDLIGGCIVQKVTEAVQRAVKDKVQNVLGIENIVGVEVKVVKIYNVQNAFEASAQEQPQK